MKEVKRIALADERVAEIHTTGPRTHIALQDERAPEGLRWTVIIVWHDGSFGVGQGSTHRAAYEAAP